MFERILVPTDGSPHATTAIEDAIELAADQDATLHALSVADSGPLGDVRLPGEAANPSEALAERAQGFVDDAVERAEAAGVEATGTIRNGPPSSEILDYAREIDADVIVMGSRGRGGLHRMAVGSVADHVIRFGEFRVLVVDAGEDATDT
ncbi:universal stress protein UspA-like protein [Halovivax ruber XH-70]|uniref:Universal stress protein UspA-like protein n=1 Tax=Halovivax ruber (strain DSM 18193 / JCM 13892 / XH-70) TaxID=797302 RepID=L0IFE2_HALRX|nr:universal stress protein [Halovivax ruber]AGB17479.1 universal stress protein UspA-like protein [Halovivax ruber XH-70]